MPSALPDRTDRTLPNPHPWHTIPAEEVAIRLGVRRGEGLTSDEALTRAAEHGPNELEEKAGRSICTSSGSR